MYLTLFLPENIVGVSQLLCVTLNVKVTSDTLKKELTTHPDYPSLLSISDTLTTFGVDNIAIKCDIDKLDSMPLPFITTIKDSGRKEDQYIFVSSIDGNNITYSENVSITPKRVSKTDFSKIWTSQTLLLVSAEDAIGDVEYESNRKRQKRDRVLFMIALFSLPILAIVTCMYFYFAYGKIAIGSICYTLLTLIGGGLSALLIFFDIDQSNSIFRQICGVGADSSCNSILNSGGSKIVGIKWSHIGFSFFIGNLIMLLAGGILNANIHLYLSLVNILAAPVILFSIFYQFRKKIFCKLCVGIQCVLLLGIFVLYLDNWLGQTIDFLSIFEGISLVALSYFIPSIFLALLRSLYDEKEQNRGKLMTLNKVKSDFDIFQFLLRSKDPIDENVGNVPAIFLGNENAKYLLTIVSNPYCGPCGVVHKELESVIARNDNIRFQFIFLTSPGDGFEVANHLLSISKVCDDDATRKAMMSWYKDDSKSISILKKNYSIQSDFESQESQIESMVSWGKSRGINATPTILVNGYELPKIYSVTELGYLLRD